MIEYIAQLVHSFFSFFFSLKGHPVLRFMIEYIAQNRHKVFSRDGPDMVRFGV